MLEKDIERKVCEYARGREFIAYKFTSPQRRSVPDRLFISPKGVMFFIEFKASGKNVTEKQAREISRLRNKNVAVFIIDDIDEGERIIDLYAAGVDAKGYCENTRRV